MNSTNNQLLANAADTILESAKILQKGPAMGKEAMDNFTRFSASIHSFQVYTFMDPAYENLVALSDFKEAVFKYEAHYVKLRNTIDEKMDQKAAKADFEELEKSLVTLKNALNVG